MAPAIDSASTTSLTRSANAQGTAASGCTSTARISVAVAAFHSTRARRKPGLSRPNSAVSGASVCQPLLGWMAVTYDQRPVGYPEQASRRRHGAPLRLKAVGPRVQGMTVPMPVTPGGWRKTKAACSHAPVRALMMTKAVA